MARLPVVDVDIHHTWPIADSLREYIDPEWRDYFYGGKALAPARSYGRLHPPHMRYPSIGGTAMRHDAFPPGGGFPGSSYEMLCEQHLDPHNVVRALLTWNYGLHPGLHHAAASVPLCRAANDFNVNHWLGQDDERLLGTICVPVGVPDEAAKEIHRLAGHPRIAGVLLSANPFHKPFGHPVYHPIYEAAAEHDLPIVMHVGSESISNGALTAAGQPTTKAEYYTTLEQPAMHHLTSLLCEGVFEKFPTLRVLFNEYGFFWVPWVLWGLDSRWESLRRENPSLKRLPSEYFHEHVWIGTQPFVCEADVDRTIALMDAYGDFSDRLCYSSDYPHWDAEWPTHVLPRLPREWRAKVMHENAARLFGWTIEASPDRAEVAVA